MLVVTQGGKARDNHLLRPAFLTEGVSNEAVHVDSYCRTEKSNNLSTGVLIRQPLPCQTDNQAFDKFINVRVTTCQVN